MTAADAIVHVIDDDEAVRQSLEFLLRTAGVAARTYESAAAFLSALPTVETGCVITDVRMPCISGIELLRRLDELQGQAAVQKRFNPVGNCCRARSITWTSKRCVAEPALFDSKQMIAI